MTHRSATFEQSAGEAYERLEFLGDAVLGLATTDWLYRCYPDLAEGELSRLKGRLVSAAVLAEHAASLGIGDCLRLGRGEERSGGRRKTSLLADALEAVLGAIFVEAGFEEARNVVTRLLEASATEIEQPSPFVETKSRLQEALQSRGMALPTYVVRSERGPDHQKIFEVEVLVQGEVVGQGTGSSKKSAQQRAARAALRRLGE